ncbi:MAG: hypothetical protein K1X67_05800 [Fimbriimonadaceae bacterium]|nr:hypothetical protein [Fimbriimonadaceae bacterium]
MEHPTPGTNAYVDGLPLVQIEPATDVDREWIGNKRKHRLEVAQYWRKRAGAFALLSLILLSVARGEPSLAILAVAIVAGVASYCYHYLAKLPEPKERWVFEGRRAARPVRRILLWSPGMRLPSKNLVVLMPGGYIASADGTKAKRLRKVKPRIVAQPGAVGERVLTDPERQEFDNLIKETRDTASAKVLVVFFLSAKAVIELGPLWFPLIAVGALALLEFARVGPGRFRFLHRTKWASDREKVTISIRSPAFAAALDVHTDPDLDAALRQIEVLESGLLWTIDDRPAAWRIYGTTPVFVPTSILTLTAIAPSLPARETSGLGEDRRLNP